MSASPRPARSSAPPQDGDVLTLNLEAKVDGEVLEDGVAEGVTYTVGSGELLDGIDEAVTGVEAGGSATFTSELKGGSAEGKEAEVKVEVTDVKSRELPELDDDFAQLASEFDTLEELQADSRKRLEQMKKYDQATQAQEKVLDELLKLVEVPIPEKLLADEIETRKHNLVNHQLGQMGLDLAKYLEIQGKTEEEFDAETKEQAEKGIKTQFILDELVNKEKLNVSQEELTEHLMRRAQSSGMSPDQFAQAVVEGGQVPMLVGEVARGKALAVVVEAATVKDSNGEVIDLDDEDETRRDRRGRDRPRPRPPTPRPPRRSPRPEPRSPRGAPRRSADHGPEHARPRVRARRSVPDPREPALTANSSSMRDGVVRPAR